MGCKKTWKTLKSPNFKFFKGFFLTLKIQILDSLSQEKIVAFQSVFIAMYIAINDVAVVRNGCIMYEISFVNFWVIILCPRSS